MPTSFVEIWEDWIWGVCLHGFCVSGLRPLLLLLLVAIIGYGFGNGLGKLPILFWRPRRPHPATPGAATGESGEGTRAHRLKQFMVGVALGALVWQVFLSGYVYEEFATNDTIDRPPLCEARPDATGRWSPPAESVPEFYEFERERYRFKERFRYDPRAWGSMWRYVLAALTGLLVFVALGLAGYFAYRTVTRGVWQLGGWTPFPDGHEDQTAAQQRDPPPYSPWLPLGLAGGMLLASGVTMFWVKVTPEFSEKYGMRMLKHAGWGKESVRQANVQAQIDAKRPPLPGPPPVANAEEKARAWYLPYAPVYAAFILNFYTLFTALLIVFCFPLRWRSFSPAVGIIFLCSILIYAQARLKYFFGWPVEYAVFVLLVLMLAHGRPYKLRFASLRRYYCSPAPLRKHYTQRAEAEAAQNAVSIAQVALDAATTTSSAGDRDARVRDAQAALEAAQKRAAELTPHCAPRLLDSNHIRYPFEHKEGRKPPLAIVCVSGGGSRAAAWAMKVLTEIEAAFLTPNQFPWAEAKLEPPAACPPVPFPHRVRLVTGASGGMVGAAAYVASLERPDGNQVNRSVPLAELFDGLCEDFLTPIVHTLVFRDMPSALLPIHLFGTDRGGALEAAWKTALRGQLEKPFSALRPDEEAAWRPSLIFTPMMVEDGRQLFISNLELSQVVRNTAHLLGEGYEPSTLNPADRDGHRLLSREGLELFKVFPDADEFPLATAARMSASFPYILPAVPLPTDPPRRVVDAGYYDNYGVGIAASWLFSYSKWVRQNTSGVVLIQIRDGVSGATRRREQVPDSPPGLLAAGLQWLTSPPSALWHFRQAAHTFRNDNLIHQLGLHFHSLPASEFSEAPSDPAAFEQFRHEFLTTVTFELQQGDDVSLNFALTEGERNTIIRDAETPGFRHQIGSLLRWWHSRG